MPKTITVRAPTMPGGKGFAAALAAMALAGTAIYTGWEGTKELPYKDIVGVWTVCSGDTRNVGPRTPRQTPEQCAARTQKILEEFGTAVATMSPGIADSQLEWTAHTIFAANIGTGVRGGRGGYYNSSIRRLYNAGDYRGACRAMRLYDKAGGRVIKGLQNRRGGTPTMIGEYELCLGGAVPRIYP